MADQLEAPDGLAGHPPALEAEALPRATVIIPHFQMPEALQRCLDSVLAQALDHGSFEVIVVDNNSASFPYDVAAAYPGCRFLRCAKPGPGLARNVGVAAARSPVLAFIDADCRAEAGWLQAAVDAVESDPERGIFGGDVRIDFIDPQRLSALEAYEAVFAFRQKFYIEKKQFSGTGNLAIPAVVHGAVGPFAGIDTAEDMDWGQRAHRAGYVTRYIEPMRIYHPARRTFAELQRKWQRHISHDLHTHRSLGRPAWRWQVQALMVLASIPIHAPRMLTSNRLSGLGNRLRGLGVLVRIRLWRVAEMRRAASAPQVSGGVYWTQQP